MAKITDGVAAQIKVRELLDLAYAPDGTTHRSTVFELAEQVGALKASIRLIHEREWPAGDKTKGARHAQKMWDIADAARNRWNF